MANNYLQIRVLHLTQLSIIELSDLKQNMTTNTNRNNNDVDDDDVNDARHRC